MYRSSGIANKTLSDETNDLTMALIPVLSVLKYVSPDFVLLLLLHPTAPASCSFHPPTGGAWWTHLASAAFLPEAAPTVTTSIGKTVISLGLFRVHFMNIVGELFLDAGLPVYLVAEILRLQHLLSILYSCFLLH